MVTCKFKMSIRTYFGSSLLMSKYLSRESRFMEKIISKNAPKRKHKVINAPTPSLFPDKNAKFINNRRISVLNKLFMKYITDIMSTGNIDPWLMDKGVEISKVSITPDFQYLNVFWYSYQLGDDENVDQRLTIAAHKIHHELSQLKLMGYVPKLHFLRDRKKNQMEKLEQLFQTIDLSARENEMDETNDDAIPDIKPDYNTLPSMASNIYGLEHDKIMKKLAVVKSKQINKSRIIDKLEDSNHDNGGEKNIK